MADPIRILHVIGLMDRGGAETLIMNLYRNIDRSKVQFDFVENRDIEGAYDPEILSLGGRIYRCPHYNGRNHFSYIKWWNKFFQEHASDYNAVHGHLGSTAAIYLSIAKKYGLYTIAHSHSVYSFNLSAALYAAYSFPTRYIADFFFGCSHQAGISRYGKTVANNHSKYKTLNCSIDVERFSYNHLVREDIRRRLHIDGKTVIGHVGRFVSAKNHHFLIQIFCAIHQKDPNCILLLIGDGELRTAVERQLSEKGLTDSVIFAGVQSDVSKFYQAMDVFVFPSLYEGFGIVALEAQTSGLPCVISDVIPNDCIVTNLVTQLSLSNPPEVWAEHILKQAEMPRSDHSAHVSAHGFDIAETAKWLEAFYLKTGAKFE